MAHPDSALAYSTHAKYLQEYFSLFASMSAISWFETQYVVRPLLDSSWSFTSNMISMAIGLSSTSSFPVSRATATSPWFLSSSSVHALTDSIFSPNRGTPRSIMFLTARMKSGSDSFLALLNISRLFTLGVSEIYMTIFYVILTRKTPRLQRGIGFA